MEILIAIAVILVGIGRLLTAPGTARRRKEEQRERLDEARIRLTEARAAQVMDQTQGIVERYRMTRENRINAMIRQSKQELEIDKLKEQIRILKQQDKPSEPFTPD